MGDHEAACELFARYAAGQDSGRFELTRDVFARDARFRGSIRGAHAVELEGREQIARFIEDTIRAQDDQRRHVITNVRVRDEDGARHAYAYLSLFVLTDAVRLKSTGGYRARLVDEDGEPRFGHLTLELDCGF